MKARYFLKVGDRVAVGMESDDVLSGTVTKILEPGQSYIIKFFGEDDFTSAIRRGNPDDSLLWVEDAHNPVQE